MWDKDVEYYRGEFNSAERASLSFELGCAMGELMKNKLDIEPSVYEARYADLLAKVHALGIYETEDEKDCLHKWLS